MLLLTHDSLFEAYELLIEVVVPLLVAMVFFCFYLSSFDSPLNFLGAGIPPAWQRFTGSKVRYRPCCRFIGLIDLLAHLPPIKLTSSTALSCEQCGRTYATFLRFAMYAARALIAFARAARVCAAVRFDFFFAA